jgi:hypothetical protein
MKISGVPLKGKIKELLSLNIKSGSSDSVGYGKN